MCAKEECTHRQMEQTPTQNIQEIFLNTSRKERTSVAIHLLCGNELIGCIRAFDKYSIILETNDEEYLIFKHAISTFVIARQPAHALSSDSAK